ncbi:Ff.00g022060.m01.CDS01 [Fusarium sp. VM40]|nr:Ff.00g022060.m01.CDS01 [Fusarium sp. VM40]
MHWHRGLEDIDQCLDDFPPLRYWMPQYQSPIPSLTGFAQKIGPILSASTHLVPPNDFSYGTKPRQDAQLRQDEEPDQDQEPDQDFNVLMHPPNLVKIVSEEIRQDAEAWNTAIEKLATAKGKSLRYDPAKMITTYDVFESDLAKATYDGTLSTILMHGRLPDLPTLPTAKQRKLSHSAQDLQRNTAPKDEQLLIPEEEKLVRINDILGLPFRANGWYNIPGILEADYATTSNVAVCIDIDQMSSRTRYIDNSRFRGMIHADTPGFGKTLFALAAIVVSAGLTGSINGLYIHRPSFVLP